MTAAPVTAQPMDRADAFLKAVEVFGEGASVGYGSVLGAQEPVFYVAKSAGGYLVYIGVGNTWEEAFRNVRQLGFAVAPTVLRSVT